MEDASVVFAGEGDAAARTIRAWRLRGTGGGPAAYLQAGLHADEIPGMLVLHRLLPALVAAEGAGRLRGDVVVVPQANPIGLRQFVHGRLRGRFDAATGRNFNRDFPAALADPSPGIRAWQAALLRLASGADIVLDLHTDDEALPYVYVHAALWPAAADLASALGAAAVIAWDSGGGGAFEDAVVESWLAEGRSEGRLAATVELRGQADVTEALAERDAAALLRVLAARGVIAGGADIPPYCGAVMPADHVQTIEAPEPGVVVFTRALGDALGAGEPFARLVAYPGDPARDIFLRAEAPGVLLTRTRDRAVDAGGVVAKLTGDRPSATWAGAPLDD